MARCQYHRGTLPTLLQLHTVQLGIVVRGQSMHRRLILGYKKVATQHSPLGTPLHPLAPRLAVRVENLLLREARKRCEFVRREVRQAKHGQVFRHVTGVCRARDHDASRLLEAPLEDDLRAHQALNLPAMYSPHARNHLCGRYAMRLRDCEDSRLLEQCSLQERAMRGECRYSTTSDSLPHTCGGTARGA